ncbi:thiol-disulfide oxidoreductase DCC family protein [Paenibacillus eucommiae]|uniref:DCC family thiol-disulfide oxidoreductase YuxK n=1 Tax=Paenibacillus eucommiae TaxID=1355755 RepID=A0ABS4J7I1_9BACL|nr:thiol-disulfide oxidoreductase DCC family protein [Paenibacillus eucommiae]MBP1995802.1 putative DCC family thiol-disulfide oxidoreductase YuxK [Paenibacillus eucommiae]
MTKASNQPATILFDGVCNLCNGAVQFIIRRDPKGHFQFAAQQSTTGQAILQQLASLDPTDPTKPGASLDPLKPLDSLNPSHPHKSDEPNTILLIEGTNCYTRSSAALRIARRLRGAWPLLYIGILIPPFIRNAIYDLIARNRYRWFGRQEQCMLPTPETKKRFLP